MYIIYVELSLVVQVAEAREEVSELQGSLSAAHREKQAATQTVKQTEQQLEALQAEFEAAKEHAAWMRGEMNCQVSELNNVPWA